MSEIRRDDPDLRKMSEAALAEAWNEMDDSLALIAYLVDDDSPIKQRAVALVVRVEQASTLPLRDRMPLFKEIEAFLAEAQPFFAKH